jgi:hypothetical protein
VFSCFVNREWLFYLCSGFLKDGNMFALEHPHDYSEKEIRNGCECARLYNL